MARISDEQWRASQPEARGGRKTRDRHGVGYMRALAQRGGIVSGIVRRAQAMRFLEQWPQFVLRQRSVNLAEWHWQALEAVAEEKGTNVSDVLRCMIERSLRARGWSSRSARRTLKRTAKPEPESEGIC